jgi:hypothetical protein
VTSVDVDCTLLRYGHFYWSCSMIPIIIRENTELASSNCPGPSITVASGLQTPGCVGRGRNSAALEASDSGRLGQ